MNANGPEAGPGEDKGGCRKRGMVLKVNFFSYFKDLTGCVHTSLEIEDGTTLAQAVDRICEKFQKLEAMRRSMLVAVGLDYQDRSYTLRPGDEISLFPPVQGG